MQTWQNLKPITQKKLKEFLPYSGFLFNHMKPANKHAYHTMKRWSNQVRIHSKLLAKSSKSINKTSLLQIEDSSFLNKPRNKRKGNKATKDYKHAQQTDPETSQISHALFSHFCTKSRQHIKEIKTPVLRHRTFTQIHEQERIRMKKNPQQARQQIFNI